MRERDAEKSQRIEEIRQAALELKSGEREDFLEKVCGADRDLRCQIETRLSGQKISAADQETLILESDSPKSSEEKSAPAPLRYQKIGRYEIRRLLGKGGMGEVYLAADGALERLVAVKILPEGIAEDSSEIQRFTREAKAISALNHPNILTIHEIGEADSLRFIVTEYIEGETLRKNITSGSLDLQESLSIAIQTAEALSAAHSAGIIHRDIKPDNIILRRDGVVKVLDFGLAKSSEINSAVNKINAVDTDAKTRKYDLTKPGMIIGTSYYMSPEQIRGRADIDERSDIWSLGVVIFEMLTRSVPFAGETFSDIAAAVLKTDAPHLSQLLADAPPELDRIVAKTLRKKPEERYQTAKDLALDLKALHRELEFSSEFQRKTKESERRLTGEQSLTGKEAEKLTRETADKQKGFFSPAKILAVLILAATGVGGIWWFFGRSGEIAQTADVSPPKTIEIYNWSSAPGEFYSVGAFSPDGKMIAFPSTKSGARNLWIKQINTGEAVQITKDEFGSENPVWSPDGEQIAFFSKRGSGAGIWQMPKLGGQPKLVAPVTDGGSTIRLWSKTNLIYYEASKNIHSVAVDSGEKRQVTDLNDKEIVEDSITVSPDEQRVAYITIEGENSSLRTKNLNDGKGAAAKNLLTLAAEIKNPVFHPDSRRIFYSATVDGTFQIFVADVDAANQPKQLTAAERDCFVLDAASDGKILYGSAKEESDIWKADIKDGREFTVVSEIDAELWANASPDKKSVAYQSIKNLSQGNNIARGKILVKQTDSADPPIEVSAEGLLPVWSPDGQSLAFLQTVENKYQLVISATASLGQKQTAADDIAPVSNTLLPYNRVQTQDFCWSPDARHIAYVSNKSGQHNIWIVEKSGAGDLRLTANEDSTLYVFNPVFSPDARRIAYRTRTGTGKRIYEISIVDADTKVSRTLIKQEKYSRLLGWSHSGKEIFLATSTEGLEVKAAPEEVALARLEIESGKLQPVAILKDVYLHNIQLSPDAKTIAFAVRRSGRDDIRLISTNGGEEKKLTANNDSRVYISNLAWSPDNNSIYFGKQSRYSLLSMISNFK